MDVGLVGERVEIASDFALGGERGEYSDTRGRWNIPSRMGRAMNGLAEAQAEAWSALESALTSS